MGLRDRLIIYGYKRLLVYLLSHIITFFSRRRLPCSRAAIILWFTEEYKELSYSKLGTSNDEKAIMLECLDLVGCTILLDLSGGGEVTAGVNDAFIRDIALILPVTHPIKLFSIEITDKYGSLFLAWELIQMRRLRAPIPLGLIDKRFTEVINKKNNI